MGTGSIVRFFGLSSMSFLSQEPNGRGKSMKGNSLPPSDGLFKCRFPLCAVMTPQETHSLWKCLPRPELLQACVLGGDTQ